MSSVSAVVNMFTAWWIFFSLLLASLESKAQKPSDDSIFSSQLLPSSPTPQSVLSFLLLGVTVSLSGCVYLWILRYVCVGCCQPVAVGAEPEALAMVV